MKILLVSGSLREKSYNTALLRKAEDMLKEKADVSFLDYSNIPYMNQDLEGKKNAEIDRVREEVRTADLVFISTPEYNHSYSGVLKNLLDWLSRPVKPGDYSSAVIRGKKVAISSVAGSSAGSFAISKLKEMLEMFKCPLCPIETMIQLGSRFGKEELILNEDEEELLKKECQSILEMI